jgi:hypothetical protein
MDWFYQFLGWVRDTSSNAWDGALTSSQVDNLARDARESVRRAGGGYEAQQLAASEVRAVAGWTEPRSPFSSLGLPELRFPGIDQSMTGFVVFGLLALVLVYFILRGR